MKRGHKILLFVGVIVLLAVSTTIVFRHQIASYALRSVIKNRSDGKIVLTIDSTYFNFLKGTVLLSGPNISFSDAYLDESQSVKLKRISLDEMLIEDISIFDVLLERKILAGKLIIKKPVIWFEEQQGEEKPSFDPDKLLQTLNQSPSEMSKLNISIKTIEIQYGSLNMTNEVNDKYRTGYVDFKLILQNFTTLPSPDSSNKRILFSDSFLFKIKNLKKLFPSGYELKIDSALFSSVLKSMKWHGVSLFAIQNDSTKRHGIDLHANSFTLNNIGIKQINSLSDIHLRSLIISNGYLYNYGDRLIKQNDDDTLNKQGIKELFTVLHGVQLDTLWLNQFNFAHVFENTDTVFLANDISMMVNGVAIDSAMTEEPLKNLIVKELLFRTGRFYAKNLIDNIDVNFSNVEYFSTEQRFELSGLHIIDNAKVRGLNELIISSGKIKIDDLSVNKFRQGLKQSVALTIIRPEIIYNTTLKIKPKERKNNRLAQFFQLERLVIIDGDLVFSNDSLSFSADGLNFTADNFEITNNGKIPFQYDNLQLDLKKIVVDRNNRFDEISSGQIFYKGDYLKIEDIQTNFPHGKEKKKSTIQIGFLELKKFQLESLLKTNHLDIAEMNINKPVLTGDLQINTKNETHVKSKNEAILPFRLDIGQLNITNGLANCKVFVASDSVKIKTVINSQLLNISGNELDSLNTWLTAIDWNVNLTSSELESGRQKINIREMQMDEINSKLFVKGFNFIHDKNSRRYEEAFEIDDLTIPEMLVTGLNYKRFIFHDTISFSKIVIDKPVFSAVIHPVAQSETTVRTSPDIAFLDKIFYDTVELRNLHFNLENRGKQNSHSFYQLQDISIYHSPVFKNDTNIFSGLVFSFNDFKYKDTISNQFVTVSSGHVNPETHNLSVSQIISGELNSKKEVSKTVGDNFYQFNGIEFSGLFLENKLPTKLTIDKLKVDNLDLYFVQKESSVNATDLEVNRNLLEKYNHIISKFKIDSTLLNNLKVNYLKKTNQEESSISFDNVALVLNNFSLDTMSSKSNSFPLNALTINLRGRTFMTRDSLYDINTGNIKYNFPHNQISVDSLSFTPRYEDSLFFDKAVYQTDRKTVFANRVEFNDFRFKEYILDEVIHIGSIDVFQVDASMERDKTYPMEPGIHKNMPQSYIRNSEQIFTIDSLRVFDSRINYTQRVLKSETPGKIFFDSLNLNVYNISNDSRFVDSSTQLKIIAGGSIMGQSRINLSAYFNLLSPADEFWFTANSETIDLTSLNSMTENLMGMSIAKGRGSIDIPRIAGDSTFAKGDLTFKYKKLKISLYNRKKAQLNKGVFSPLVDFMINDLLLKSNNPRFARSPRIGQAYFVRDTQKGIVNFVFKSSLSGIISTLGINNKNQRKEKKNSKGDEKPESNNNN